MFKERRYIMRSLLFLLGVLLVGTAIFMAGCSAGVRNLGNTRLLDGSLLEAIQIGSEGQDGAKVTAVETYVLIDRPGQSPKSVKVGEYVGIGSSLTADILRGFGAASVNAAGYGVGQYLRRPNQTSVLQGGSTFSGGNAEASSSSSASSSASSEASAVTEGGASCHGNCGGGNNGNGGNPHED